MHRSDAIVVAGLLALTALGCSDSTGPLAGGAVFVQSVSGCGVSGSARIPMTGAATNSTQLGELARDGDSTNVQCAVTKRADGFALSGSLVAGSPRFIVTDGTISYADGKGTGKAKLEFYFPDFGNVTTGSELCDISIQAPEKVQAGAIWASFDCPNLKRELQTCSATGAFAFENCDK